MMNLNGILYEWNLTEMRYHYKNCNRGTFKNIRGTKQKFNEVFTNVEGPQDYESICSFISRCYDIWLESNNANNSRNGYIFEYLFIYYLKKRGIEYSYQKKVNDINDAIYDIVINHKTREYVLFLKTSIRERYKQAEIEAIWYKKIYEKSKCFIITMDINGSEQVNSKINRQWLSGLDYSFCLRR